VGALLVHVAVKLPAVRDAFAGGLTEEEEAPPPSGPAALTRRSLLRVTWVAAGATVLATAAAGVPGLRRVSVLAVRTGDGPGGVPVNRSAAAAGVTGLASDPDYALTVTGPGGTVRLGRTELEALPQHSADLPIACVEGWSASGTWTGVRVRDLVALVAAPPGAAVLVRSLQPRGAYRESRLPGSVARDPLTLLALGLGGKPLSLDHGYPCRVIAPNRPGVLQTKWVSHLEVEA
jgi:DMSO/TMAO reductase YedYZ molybdopterin-dependent catalytic subunit